MNHILQQKYYKQGFKKKASASSLAMRFYVSDGWTKEELDLCCVRGEFQVHFPGDERQYYTLTAYSGYDVDKLMDKISEIHNPFDKEMTKRQLLEDRNW